MAEFLQHLPGYVTGIDPARFEFTDFKKEVLEKYSHWVESGEYHWCYNPGGNGMQYLMVITENNDKWWVVGFVKDYDLSKYLPKAVLKHKVK